MRDGWGVGWIILAIVVLIWVLASPDSGHIDQTGPVDVCYVSDGC